MRLMGDEVAYLEWILLSIGLYFVFNFDKVSTVVPTQIATFVCSHVSRFCVPVFLVTHIAS